MVREIHSQLASILKPRAPPSKHADALIWGEKKFYFWFWQQTPSHILPVENDVSQPQTHWELHNLILILERWVVFDHYFHQPCQKVQGKQGGNDSFRKTQFFHLPQESRFLSLDYSWAIHVLFCEEKSSISNKFIPVFWKMARGTESDNFFNYSELFNTLLRRDQRINFLYHYLLCLFKRLRFKIKHIKFPV